MHVLPIGTKTRRTSENKKEAAANGINSKIGAQYEVALLMPFLMPPHYLALARSVEGLSICERERGNSKHFYRATALRWTYLIWGSQTHKQADTEHCSWCIWHYTDIKVALIMCLETCDIQETYCVPWTLENKRKRQRTAKIWQEWSTVRGGALMPFLMPPHYLALARSEEVFSICERERGGSSDFYTATALRRTYLVFGSQTHKQADTEHRS